MFFSLRHFTEKPYGSVVEIDEAFKELENSEKYKKIRKNIPYIDGTFDDHDYGLNDGGGWLPFKNETQQVNYVERQKFKFS